MKIEFNFQNKVVCLPAAAVQKAESATEEDLKVLLHLAALSDPDRFDAAKLAVELDMPERSVENAVSFWRGAGILKTSRSPKAVEKEEPAPGAPAPVTMRTGVPSYTGKEIEEIMAQRRRLEQLLEECQKVLGRVFNVSESNLLIALQDVLHLDEDYVLLLCKHCAQQKEGSATMRYVYNTAYRLYEEGVLSVQALEEYIAAEECRRDLENYLRALFGWGGRKLTNREKKFADGWKAAGFAKEVIALAYETSVDSVGELSLPHMNKILENWKAAGVKTKEDAEKQREAHREENKKLYPAKTEKAAGKGQPQEFSSFDAEDFFKKAAKKSEDMLKDRQ